MNTLLIISFLCFAFCKQSLAFINGFPKEQCDEMDPTKVKLEGAKGAPDAEFNETESNPEDAPPTSIRLSDSLNLYRIVTSSPMYRRGRTLDITIRGPDFNAFMLQVRKFGTDERRGFDQAVRVGEFVEWPNSVKPVMCDKNEKNALTNKNYASKSGLTFKWKAPNEDVGDIQIVARFISGDEYWQITESREIPMNEFQNLKQRCFFRVGEHEKLKQYCGRIPQMNECISFYLAPNCNSQLVTDKSIETRNFFREFKNTKMNKRLENKKMDLDGDRMWCSFVAPMVTQGEEGNGLDLSVPLFQIYLRGQTNYTRGSNFPILPAKYLTSKKEVSVDKIKLQYHTMEKPKQQSSAEALNYPFYVLISAVVTITLWENVRRSL
ncbi:Reelin domain-containing protein 1 [Argiope bruennichi]|uniref:Reelin domain-containing protein 1 n=1 Tax=Argiope bruennichi TaxID=94029 RepID=A0A8T0E8S7_ARGBR|nr:Reelin domain-containing protein 1 [Argiope bruennichi]